MKVTEHLLAFPPVAHTSVRTPDIENNTCRIREELRQGVAHMKPRGRTHLVPWLQNQLLAAERSESLRAVYSPERSHDMERRLSRARAGIGIAASKDQLPYCEGGAATRSYGMQRKTRHVGCSWGRGRGGGGVERER